MRFTCPPKRYSLTVLLLIFFTYFLVACITSYVIVQRTYPSLKDGSSGDHWVLMGGLTSSSISFRIRRNDDDDLETLLVATDDSFDSVVWTSNLTADDNSTAPDASLMTSATVTNLEASTEYFYRVLTSSASIVASGRFQTAPRQASTSSFEFVTAGCAWTGSQAKVFDRIRESHPDALFFAHLGDVHYEDLNTPDIEERIQAVDRTFASEPQRQLFANRPMVYMWDDHDWLGNNAGGDPSQVGYEAALEQYRISMPYYEPLPSPTSMYHAFTIGRVRFIVSDLRSEADNTDDATSTTPPRMYSQAQKEWLFAELESASEDSDVDFIIWITTKPWIGSAKARGEGGDSWRSYAQEREDLSNHIQSIYGNSTKRNLLAIASDAHMLAFDDGSNTFYGTVDDDMTDLYSFPLLQSGPLDRLGSTKGGPFSDGCETYDWERNHQYIVLRYSYDDEQNLPCLELQAYREDGLTGNQVVFTQELCGTDIFAPVNPGTGSCSSKSFSVSNKAMIAASIAFLVACMGLLCCTNTICKTAWEAVLLSVLIFLLFVLTFAAGFAIPLAKNVSQYDAHPTMLIAVLQSGTGMLYLIAWRAYGTEKEEADDSNL